MTDINRETYNLLDFLGDVGGLNDGLFYAFKLVVGPFSALAYTSAIAASLTKLRRRSDNQGDVDSDEEKESDRGMSQHSHDFRKSMRRSWRRSTLRRAACYKEDRNKTTIAKAISKDLQKTVKFKSFSLLYSLFECIFARKYHKMR